jgi:hypothetical protein
MRYIVVHVCACYVDRCGFVARVVRVCVHAVDTLPDCQHNNTTQESVSGSNRWKYSVPKKPWAPAVLDATEFGYNNHK